MYVGGKDKSMGDSKQEQPVARPKRKSGASTYLRDFI